MKGLRHVESAVGSLLPLFALQVLAHAATLHGVVDGDAMKNTYE